MQVFLTICTMLCKVHLITVYKNMRVLYMILKCSEFKDIFNQFII